MPRYHHEARASLLGSVSDEYDQRSVSPSSLYQYPPTSYKVSGKFEEDGGGGWKDDYTPGNQYSPYGGRVPESYGHAPDHYAADPIVAAPGGYAQREGFIPGSPAVVRNDGMLGSLRFWPSSRWQWVFALVVLGQAIAGLALECFVFATFQVNIAPGVPLDSTSRTVTVYLSLFIFGYVYQVLLTYDALRMKNTIQLIGLCIYNIGLLIEAALELDQVHDAVMFLDNKNEAVHLGYWSMIQGYIIAVPCLMGLGTVLMIFTTWKLNTEFSWSIYKDISADVKVKRRFLAYQIYIALLKFDLFFFLAFTVQFLVVVPDTQDFEADLTIAAIPITIILLFLAAYWVQRESLWGMVLIIFFYLVGMAYFFFKLVRMYYAPPQRIVDYLPARRALTTFAIITILLLFITTAYAIWCTHNFNTGLKEHISRGSATRSNLRRTASVDLNTMYAGGHGEAVLVGGPAGNRITIE